MEALATTIRPKSAIHIPDDLIWEVLDGQPLYRRGYMDVVRKLKTRDEIMGTSSYQSLITTYLTKLLARQLDDDVYDFLISEPGVHLKYKDNISNDIAIFNRLSPNQITKKYFDFAPKIVIEIDIDIDPTSMDDLEYLDKKTKKMLAFGVEKVIWILTNNREIIIATPNTAWLTLDWNTTIEIIDGISFNIYDYLLGRGVDI
jgi:hypothetical protein